jgi:hypothetical protein
LAISVARLSNLANGTNQYQKKMGVVSDNTHTISQLAEQSGISVAAVNYAKTVLSTPTQRDNRS